MGLMDVGRSGPVCPTCQGAVGKSTQSSGYFIGIVLAMIVFMVGLAITILNSVPG